MKSRSALFLMEQLVVILVFALCAAVCVSIFAEAYVTANGTRDAGRALASAKSAAEGFLAYGDVTAAADALRGYHDGSSSVCFDADWRVCREADAFYVLRLAYGDGAPAALSLCELSVRKTTGEELIAFTVAARTRGYE